MRRKAKRRLKTIVNRALSLLMCALTCLSSLLPATGNIHQRRTGGHTKKVAVGVLYSYSGGSHIQYAKLKTQRDIISFSITDGTKTNFKSYKEYQGSFDKNWWNLGAEWRVVYEDPNNPEDEFGAYAESVMFTGRVEPSIAGANALAYQYLDLLSNRNTTNAYAKLSGGAKQSISFDAFVKMYRSIDVTWRSAVICSHSTGKVNLLLAPTGIDGSAFQRSEISRLSGGWYITSLSGFQESGNCAQ